MKSANHEVVVVGSGIAGLRTATALADMGLPVALVERAQRPGGHAAEWACMATDTCAKCSACLVQDQIGKATRHPLIRLILGAEVNSVTGAVGDYRLALTPTPGTNGQRLAWPGLQLSEPEEIAGSSVVMATGFDMYSAAASPMLGYGRFDGVTTTQDLDEALRQDSLSSFLPEEVSSPKLAFIQCVGSRDRQRGRQYCSQFCCQTTIRLARRLRHLRPELEITVFYIDLQVMSKEFVAFYQQARDEGIHFRQGVPAEIVPGEERALRVFGVPSGSSQAVSLEFDRIVLAIGLAPTASHPELAETLGIELNELGYFPTNGSGSAKVTGRPGVYFVGGCAGPTDIQGSCRQALAVATQVAGVVRTTDGDPELMVAAASATITR